MTSCFPNFSFLLIPLKIQELKNSKWGPLNKVCLANIEALQFILGMPRRTNKMEDLNVLRQTDQFPQTLIERCHVTSTVVPLILLDNYLLYDDMNCPLSKRHILLSAYIMHGIS